MSRSVEPAVPAVPVTPSDDISGLPDVSRGTVIPHGEWGLRGRELRPVVRLREVYCLLREDLCGRPLKCQLEIDSLCAFAKNPARKGVEVGCDGPDLYVCFSSGDMGYMIVVVEFVSEAARLLAVPGDKAPVQLTFNCYYQEDFVRERRALWNRCS
eukprot:61960-Rhodomonas_salina.1